MPSSLDQTEGGNVYLEEGSALRFLIMKFSVTGLRLPKGGVRACPRPDRCPPVCGEGEGKGNCKQFMDSAEGRVGRF